jgi:hypothetical protein
LDRDIYINKVEEKSQVEIKINVEAKIKPWWNADCSLAFAKIIIATKNFKKTGNVSDFLTKKKAEAISKRVNRKVRNEYWKTKCSSISHQTPLSEAWTIVRSMNGNQKRRVSTKNVMEWMPEFILVNSPLDPLYEIDFSKFVDNENAMLTGKISTNEIRYTDKKNYYNFTKSLIKT